MIWTSKTLNGDVVEVTSADVFSGPEGRFGRQHGNATVAWIRVPGRTDWTPSAYRSEHRTRMAITVCATAKDVVPTLQKHRR